MARPVIPSERSESRNLACRPAGRLAVVAAALLCVFASTCALAAAPPDPSVRLYDTAMLLSDTLRPQSLDERPGWTLIPEDTLAHKFSGDFVLMNNRVAVARAMDVYARTSAGWFKRASLSPFAMPLVGNEAVRVVENTPGAVQLALTHQNLSTGTVCYGLRLVAGEPLVEVRPDGGMGRFEFFTSACHLIVPEFFGDDLVYAPRIAQPRDPSDVKPRQAPPDEKGDIDEMYKSLEDQHRKAIIGGGVVPETAIPAENLLLSLQGKGSSVVVCVWEGAERQVGAFMVLPGRLADLRLECVQGRRVWLACLEKEGLWREFAVAEGGAPADILRTFKPPFPAKWRASFVGAGGVCESITFEEPPEKAPVPDDWRGPVILYPIDRSRGTPLTTILPMDVLRSTLGVGPCQYILDAEGLGGDEPAPPDAVLAWLERLITKRRAARSAEEIEERLDVMLNHLAAARARIDDYAAFGREVRHVCREAAKRKKRPRPSSPSATVSTTTFSAAGRECRRPRRRRNWPARSRYSSRSRAPLPHSRHPPRPSAPSATPSTPRSPAAAWPRGG